MRWAVQAILPGGLPYFSVFDPTDWLSILITVIGGWIIVEGLLILAFGDWFMQFSARLMGKGGRAWAAIAILFGLAAVFAALYRLQV